MLSELMIPVMDQTTETVALTGWLLHEGDAVRQGQAVCEIETDKATVEIAAPADGFLRKILVAAGTQVPPRTVVALIGERDEPLPEIDPYYRTARAAAPFSVPATPTPVERPAAQKLIVSPRARRLAEAHNLDLNTVTGSGPGGRILEEDVQQALAAVPAAPPANLRAAQAKAERVSRSWQTIPHFFTAITVDLTRAAAAKAAGPSGITFTDYFALALGRTLPDHPDLNGFWKEALERAAEVRLGLVVEAEHGLVIPALADLRGRSLADIAAERERVVAQARAGKLAGEAAATPTFSLTNVGPGHIDAFTAIISPPQVAMLTAGSVRLQPKVVGAEVVARQAVTFTLCADHRAVDGRQAARFLEQLKQTLEHENIGV